MDVCLRVAIRAPACEVDTQKHLFSLMADGCTGVLHGLHGLHRGAAAPGEHSEVSCLPGRACMPQQQHQVHRQALQPATTDLLPKIKRPPTIPTRTHNGKVPPQHQAVLEASNLQHTTCEACCPHLCTFRGCTT